MSWNSLAPYMDQSPLMVNFEYSAIFSRSIVLFWKTNGAFLGCIARPSISCSIVNGQTRA